MPDSYPNTDSAGVLFGQRRVSTEDLAYHELRTMLVTRRLEPSGSLSEEALAAALGVSRTPLRQALARLRLEGLVDRAPNGRLFVTPVSAADAGDLFSVRCALEELALEQAFPHLNESLLRTLRGLLAHMDAVGDAGGETVAKYGGEFHAVLYRAGGNALNLALLGQLQARIDRYRFLSTATGPKRQRDAVKEHRIILAALEAADLPRAKAALREHLGRAQASVLKAFTMPARSASAGRSGAAKGRS